MSAADPVPREIPVEAAVAAALRELPRFIGHQPANPRVEEVFPPDDEDHREYAWRITLSYVETGTAAPANSTYKQIFGELLPKPPADERVMRVLVVDASTGNVVAMRARQK